MTQATPIIGANKSGIEYRNLDNDGKQALLNHHKGSTAPSYKEAGVIWLDDSATPYLLKIYDGADWIVAASVNATTNAVEAYHGTAPLRLLNHATDTGSANAYAVAPVPAITAYATGQVVTLKPANASTGAATLAVSGLAAKNIKLLDGSNPASGALATTGVYQLVYDGTNFVLLNPSLGSAAYLTAGTSANNLVQLNGSAKLPAVDGSLLTNLPGGGYSSPGYVTGRYYSGLLYTATGSTGVVTANRLYIAPLMLGAAGTFTKVGIKVTSATSGNCRLGIYNMANGIPTSLIADFGTVSTGTTGEKEITISQALSAGCYALVAVFDATPTVVQYDQVGSTGGVINSFYGGAAGDSAYTFGAYSSFTYGALPSPHGLSLTYINGGTIPFIWLRP